MNDADEFARLIVHTLAAHPDWTPTAMIALHAGTREAINTLNRQRADADMACLAALALCDTKRLSREARAGLLAVITEAMHPPGLSEIEKKFAGLAIAENAAARTGDQP